ncbi:MAG: hypothetical protein BWZ02_01973 [Lentisphaerae bacterium ADurb.BinA184]|nr:MAG: hypothetical protein BWZ02_01973 [Lentisphaerae bacterium ADurb.BinA184]
MVKHAAPKATHAAAATAPKDLTILRSLAARLAEIGALAEQREKADLWRRLNRLERTRPLILLQNATWHETGEVIRLQCEGEWARHQEWGMRAAIWHWDNVHDDAVYDSVAYAPIVVRNTGWGMAIDATRPEHVFGACHYNPILKGDEDPATKIALPTVTVDAAETDLAHERLAAVWDGILPLRRRGVAWSWFAMMDLFIQWRGLDNTFLDMVDRPAWIHAWMNRMTDWHLAEWEQYEKLGLLSLNNGDCGAVGVGPGGLGITDCLPARGFDAARVRRADLWGHATTQIFAEVSPAMHDEFALAYESRLLSRFGLAGYGCCEPLHLKVDLIRRRIPNLRRMSMSPWADVEAGAQALRNEVIFSYKPNPAILGMATFDVNEARRQLRDVFERTRGCVIEVIMKDLHTVNRQPQRMGEWTRMALELAQEYA